MLREPVKELLISSSENAYSWKNVEEKRKFAQQLFQSTIGNLWDIKETNEGLLLLAESREIRDLGSEIILSLNDDITVHAALRLALEKGWTTITLSGDESLQLLAMSKADNLGIAIQDRTVDQNQVEQYKQTLELEQGFSW